MTYEEAKPFLKEGMTIKVTGSGCGNFESKIISGTTGVCCTSSIGHCFETPCEQGDIEILINPDGSPWVQPKKFKVGDRVRVVKKGVSVGSSKYFGREGTVIKVSHGDLGDYCVLDIERHQGGIYFDELEKVEDQTKVEPDMNFTKYMYRDGVVSKWFNDDWVSVPMLQGTKKVELYFNQTKGPMVQKPTKKMSVIKALKAKLSPVDRQLVKNGYLTSTGERTSSYESELKDAAIAELIETQDTPEFRAELAKALRDEDESN